ncbi:glycosyltransferase [Marinobacter halophilus]|uniref:Glycosyl transferase family 1 domain-containing protein n=1 Tax=Marinobacter halophilus TaxID=1323740 RepID=A0A2T1KCA0_9GAMM|nr:glycosyltransferase [Marinobacter halophilus]PSF07761.1 hypothetical protein C7H08_10120 [Marinobacter halophilus]GGC56858.1 O-antigen biosynthesis glycosyl transferase family 4 [Marinobacter halophilus]
MNRYKYVHIITSLESGGAQKALIDFLSLQSEHVRSRTLVVFLIKKNFYNSKLSELGVDAIRGAGVKNFYNLVKIIRNKNNVIVSWMYHASIFTLFKFGVRKKVVWTIHHGKLDLATDSLSTLLAFFFCALLSRLIPDEVVYVSNTCKSDHIKFGFSATNAVVIYNYLKLEKEVEVSQSKRFDVLFVGRAHPNKNVDLFMEFCIKLCAIQNRTKVCVIGAGTERYREFVSDKFKGNFLFLGEVRNTLEYFADSRVYVCTSRVESFGLTVVEALRSGCAVVCPNQPIFHEIAGSEANFFEKYSADCVLDSYLDLTQPNPKSVEGLLSRFSKESTVRRLTELLNESNF